MRDEHLIYTELSEGRYKILPEEGYTIFCILTNQHLIEAIAKENKLKWFVSEPQLV